MNHFKMSSNQLTWNCCKERVNEGKFFKIENEENYSQDIIWQQKGKCSQFDF